MYAVAGRWTCCSKGDDAVDEGEWLTGNDPTPMVEFLRGKARDRKFRLFQVACCRRVWNLLPDDPCREAVLVAERYADGHATDRERRAIRNRVAGMEADDLTAINARGAVFRANAKTTWRELSLFFGVAAVLGHAANPTKESGSALYKAAYQAEKKAEASLVRCVFGNPFRPRPALSSSLLDRQDGLVAKLAEAAYAERLLPSGHLDPTRLAVLADALEEAGCHDADLLSHLREPGPHVRGCWPVDLALRKE
jgi:hypothetical protein